MEWWYSPFAVCIVIVSCFAISAILLLRKFEGAKESHNKDPSLAGVVPVGYLSRFELWSSCGGALNPSWLLLYRGLCVLYLLPILTYNVVQKGGFVFLFYTECTFTLLVVYFALAFRQSFLHWLRPRGESITHQHHRLLDDDVEADDKSVVAIDLRREMEEEAGLGGYVTQCVFQAVYPAAILTDLVYWGLLIPVFLPSGMRHGFVDLNMHAVNLVLLTIEFALNSLRFPWFRLSYFILWSSAYCFLQWTVHSTGITNWWPYPFMNVDSPYAPAWYSAIIFFHAICAAICLLLALVKHSVWSRFNLPVSVK